MTPKRIFYVLWAGLALIISLTISSVFYGQKLIQSKSAELTNAKVNQSVSETQQGNLNLAKADIKKYEELNIIAKTIVPQDKDQAKTIREINNLAAELGIPLRSIGFSSSNLGQAPAASTPTTGSAPTDPAKAAVKAPDVTQIKPVDGIPGLYYLEITISSVDTQPIPYPTFIKFLQKLETNRRTAHVDKLTIKPNKDGTALSFNLTLRAYLKP